MKPVRVSDIFNVNYGNSLELNRLKHDPNGINFVSRTSKNNGVSAKVKQIKNVTPSKEGAITVALGGSVLESFLQPEPFYSGYHIFILEAKFDLSDEEKLYYCFCISANKYRYNYGRQANRTLRDLPIPSNKDIPVWVYELSSQRFDKADEQFTINTSPQLNSTLYIGNTLSFRNCSV